MSDQQVLVSELTTNNGCVLGSLTLNTEASLNSLTLDMIRNLNAALQRWQQRDDVVAVVLAGQR